ncbi:MAG TPA: N-acetyltransferase [Blastocatellia bacterium]|nr:N-acetyltransferase [Blastocatellia bacterium]
MSQPTPARVAAPGVEVHSVRTARDRRRFLGLPYNLYKGNPHWVPPLRIAQKDLLNTKRHPFYKTSNTEMFLAEREGRVVGRVMAILNRAHNEFHQERAGFFGFFEVENDPEAATLLLDSARDWLRSRGAEVMRGPMNPSTNYECGLLIDAFDRSPVVMMTYNPPYYVDLIEGYGLRKAMDLYAYDTGFDYFVQSDKLKRVAQRLREKDRIRVRPVKLKEFKREAEIVRAIYNEAWGKNWGFVPVSPEEFDHLAKDLKQLVDPEIAFIAEQEEEGSSQARPIGFFLAVPDINRALKRINGRLLPFGLLKLLWYSRKIGFLRVVIMGTVADKQNLGAAAVFYDEIYRRAPAAGYLNGEIGWILENNALMLRAADLLGARRSKTYRIYETELIEKE